MEIVISVEATTAVILSLAAISFVIAGLYATKDRYRAQYPFYLSVSLALTGWLFHLQGVVNTLS